jgi:hypothetical protein
LTGDVYIVVSDDTALFETKFSLSHFDGDTEQLTEALPPDPPSTQPSLIPNRVCPALIRSYPIQILKISVRDEAEHVTTTPDLSIARATQTVCWLRFIIWINLFDSVCSAKT